MRNSGKAIPFHRCSFLLIGRLCWPVLYLLVACQAAVAQAPALRAFSEEFWRWRALNQPCSGDDIPRIVRPPGWVPDFSPQALQNQRRQYREFVARLNELPGQGWTRSDSVDFLLLRAAVERVNWELNVLQLPFRNPDFYVHQTLGSLFELLIQPPPWNQQWVKDFQLRLQAIPTTLQHAQANLSDPVKPFARIAIENLTDVRSRLETMVAGMKPHLPPGELDQLRPLARRAGEALARYRQWLEKQLPQMRTDFAIGRQAYQYFLRKIALIPYSPEQLLQMGRQEWERAVAFESYEQQKNRSLPPLPLFGSLEEQIQQQARQEEAIRQFLTEKGILTIPANLPHYKNLPIPDYLKPIQHMGVLDDLTDPGRLDQPAVRYIPEPSPGLSFFAQASARDPGPIIIHEGIPGHYFQLWLSWQHPDPIRRHFYDSGPNEGIAFYWEEVLLQLGLFDDSPRSRELIYRFMRLRALRVEVDIRLALGQFSIEQAGEYLARTVPMDLPTATWEAGFFAYNPGQAISYQIGKLQIFKFLSDARWKLGSAFQLKQFHDALLLNGNVPIALQRWEMLGLQDEVKHFFEP